MGVSHSIQQHGVAARPDPKAVLTLLKPVTWFPPMWAFTCGVVSSGQPLAGRWGLWVALAMTVLSLALGWTLGPWGFGATVAAVLAAWAYSVEPVRLKRSGIWGPGLVGLSYETLPWITGAAVLAAGAPDGRVLAVALAYGIGAHGIMTFNDFKALEGDRQMGIASLPVTLGPDRAARVACAVMLVPQVAVAGALWFWGAPIAAGLVAALIALQLLAMRRMLRDPKALAPWFNGTGVLLSVSGMMVAAVALGGM
jgi:chlorophyll synthase